ncbi:hypothetical protein Ahy_B06g085264 [Arachis hypogaea]|uniref:Zinc knuckle CX2CX4HX4C domain-containing protein n=1 Tax=Arachis hypogaea TaxID=3818 RepID=A0A444YU09_ARAHY|nr:hypothetical protein Ahy_B06g085264 [Arachis hypogaea]
MLKIDELTSIHFREKFARIYVKIDLRKQIVPSFTALKKGFKLEYEGLHQICFKCGRYGHRMKMPRICGKNAQTRVSDSHGQWPDAKTRRRRRKYDNLMGSPETKILNGKEDIIVQNQGLQVEAQESTVKESNNPTINEERKNNKLTINENPFGPWMLETFDDNNESMQEKIADRNGNNQNPIKANVQDQGKHDNNAYKHNHRLQVQKSHPKKHGGSSAANNAIDLGDKQQSSVSEDMVIKDWYEDRDESPSSPKLMEA